MRRSVGVVLAVVLLGPGVIPASPVSAATLPAVNMEAVLKAAQWDPRKADTAITSGSGPSVLRVEQALYGRGLLDARFVDGHYGTSTVSAYVRWQRSLGFSGIGANGIPGETSLTKLGTGRFTVTYVVRPGSRTTFGGEVVDKRTAAMLAAAENRSGLDIRLDQGSYSTDDPTSAGTHDGGGVVDVDVDRWSSQQRTNATRSLREVGFAAWYRTPAEGDWPYHIHAVAISDPDLSPTAQAQAGDYYMGRNGLRNQLPDTGPLVVPKVTWEEFQRQT